MKRRYKAGDWFRVPLGGERDAVGIIARACQSRLFGYFFAVPASHAPSHDELKAFRSQDAIASALFGGTGLEDARWRVIATSVPFDPPAWPFPQFVSRGAFGRTWTAVRYDPVEMRIVERTPIDEASVALLPDARFATPPELEDLLRARIAGVPSASAFAICEVGAPVDATQLRLLAGGGRLQFSEHLSARDIDTLAQFHRVHPHVQLRIHGLERFDARALGAFTGLRALILEVACVEHAEALGSLRELESLTIGAMAQPLELTAVQDAPELRRLELRGRNADVEGAMRLPHLEDLALIDTPSIDWSGMASKSRLRSLLVAHGSLATGGLAQIPSLACLRLQNIALDALPDFSTNAHLRFIELRNIAGLTDLAPLASAPALHELRIEGMPQLNVPNFAPLICCPALRRLTVDVGSKAKSREVYRMLHLGTFTA